MARNAIAWKRVRAGQYASPDGRFEIERQSWTDGWVEQEEQYSATEWFLYDGGNMVGAYDTLREAKAIAVEREVEHA